MRIRLFVLAILSGFLMPLHAQSPDTNKATIYFYRLRAAYGALLKPSIFCDKVQVVRMRNGRFVSAQFAAGSHTITSTFPGNGLVLDLTAGGVYYIRLGMTQAGLIHGGRGEITVIAPEQGKYEVSQLKPAETDDLKVDAASGN